MSEQVDNKVAGPPSNLIVGVIKAKPRRAREAYLSETSARGVATEPRKFRYPKFAPPPSSPAEQAVHCGESERATDG